jgi:hypothetical protein
MPLTTLSASEYDYLISAAEQQAIGKRVSEMLRAARTAASRNGDAIITITASPE